MGSLLREVVCLEGWSGWKGGLLKGVVCLERGGLLREG